MAAILGSLAAINRTPQQGSNSSLPTKSGSSPMQSVDGSKPPIRPPLLEMICPCTGQAGSCPKLEKIMSLLESARAEGNTQKQERFATELLKQLIEIAQHSGQKDIFSQKPEQIERFKELVNNAKALAPANSEIVAKMENVLSTLPKVPLPEKATSLAEIQNALSSQPVPTTDNVITQRLELILPPRVLPQDLNQPQLPVQSKLPGETQQHLLLQSQGFHQVSPPKNEGLTSETRRESTALSKVSPQDFPASTSLVIKRDLIPKTQLESIIIATKQAPETLPTLAKEIVLGILAKQPDSLPKLVQSIIQTVAKSEIHPETTLNNIGELAKVIATTVIEKAPEQLPRIIATIIKSAQEVLRPPTTFSSQLFKETPITVATVKHAPQPEAPHLAPTAFTLEKPVPTPQRIIAQILDQVVPIILQHVPDQLSEVLHVVAQTVKNMSETQAKPEVPIQEAPTLSKEQVSRPLPNSDLPPVSTIKADQPVISAKLQPQMVASDHVPTVMPTQGTINPKVVIAETAIRQAPLSVQAHMEAVAHSGPIQTQVPNQTTRASLTNEIKQAVLETIKVFTTQPEDQFSAALVKLVISLAKGAPEKLPTILPKIIAKAEAQAETHTKKQDPLTQAVKSTVTNTTTNAIELKPSPAQHADTSKILSQTESEPKQPLTQSLQPAKPTVSIESALPKTIQTVLPQLMTVVAQLAPQQLQPTVQAILAHTPSPLQQAAIMVQLLALPATGSRPLPPNIANTLQTISPALATLARQLPSSVSEILPQVLTKLEKSMASQQAGQFLQSILQLPTPQSVKILQLLTTFSQPTLVALGNILNQLSSTQITKLTQLLASLPKGIAEVLITVLSKLATQTIGKVLTLLESLPPQIQEGLVNFLAKLSPTEIKGLLAKLELLASHEVEAFLATVLGGESENERIKKRKKFEQDQILVSKAQYLGSQESMFAHLGLDGLRDLARYRREKIENDLLMFEFGRSI